MRKAALVQALNGWICECEEDGELIFSVFYPDFQREGVSFCMAKLVGESWLMMSAFRHARDFSILADELASWSVNYELTAHCAVARELAISAAAQ